MVSQSVYRLHDIPAEIVSDRDPCFTGASWKDLQRLLGTKLCMSTAYHPQTDGQTERANRVVEEVLRHTVNQAMDNWDELLAGVELAINTTVKRSTGMSPFMLSHGRKPILPFNQHLMPRMLLNELTDEAMEAAARSCGALTVPMTAANESKVPAARLLHGKMSRMYTEAKKALTIARQRQQEQTDRHRRDTSRLYPVGGKAVLSTKNINLQLPSGGTKKLMPRYVGPFEILERIGKVAYRLKLSKNFKGLHNVFHVSRLHPWREDGPRRPPKPPESFELEGEPYWNVEKILTHEHRIVGKRIKTLYTVHWEGFPEEESTEEPADNLKYCTEPLKAYQTAVQEAGGTLDPPADLLRSLTARRRGRRPKAAAPAPPVASAAAPPPPLADALPTSRSDRPLTRSMKRPRV